MPVLKVEGLKTHFFTEEGVVKAVDGVSFTLDRGEVLGIVGESGSGKSVMSLSMLRLIPDPPGRIVAGKIVLDTEAGKVEIASASEQKMQKIRGDRVAMIFQDPMTSLNPYLTVGTQLLEVLELHKKDLKKKAARAKVVEMLTAVGIPDAERRMGDHPHQLSGGMRQRVMIAMALLCDPEVLIADEPTTALDVTIQAQILELIRERKEETGTAVILITHDLGVVARLADRVAVMYAGRIIEEGPAARIFDDPRHPYTVGLARSIPRLEPMTTDAAKPRRLVPIPGMPPSLAKLHAGCAFAARCPCVRPECSETFPPIRDLGKGHRVACHEKDLEKVRRAPAATEGAT